LRYLKKKIIGKELNEFYTYIDALKGDVVSLEKGIRVRFDTSLISGLTEQEIKVLKAILHAKEMSVTEVSFKTGLSETTVRNILKILLEKNLIKSKKISNAMVYSSFTKFSMPNIKDIKQNKVELTEEKISAELVKPKLDIKDVKTIINGIDNNTEIISKKEIYYPFYEAIVLKKDKKSKVEMDAMTGKIS
jgi:predicted transcriptional regulator